MLHELLPQGGTLDAFVQKCRLFYERLFACCNECALGQVQTQVSF